MARKSKKPELQAELKTTLTVEEVQKLPIERQADMVYTFLGRATDTLADLGFDPSVIANVAWDLGHDLTKRDGAPVRVSRIDPRGRGAKR